MFRRPHKRANKLCRCIQSRESVTYLTNDILNGILNDADTGKINSSLYPIITEDQFQAYSKKILNVH